MSGRRHTRPDAARQADVLEESASQSAGRGEGRPCPSDGVAANYAFNTAVFPTWDPATGTTYPVADAGTVTLPPAPA